MIKLKNITKNNDIVSFNLFVEDCKEQIKCEYKIKNKEFVCGALPVGYEWCKAHTAYARREIESMIKSGEFQESKTVMWY